MLKNSSRRPARSFGPEYLSNLLGVQRWSAVLPGLRLFELRGDAEQQVFAAVGGDQLYADRQSIVIPVQWQRDAGLARYVEWRCKHRIG